MTREEFVAFAARITAAIDTRDLSGAMPWRVRVFAADRERVASDLAGYLRALDGLAEHEQIHPAATFCERCTELDHLTRIVQMAWPCPDARRYTEDRDDRLAGLTRTGALYGEKP